MKYTFGDTPTADDRLKRIASFFNPKAEEFIKPHLNGTIDTAIDLGCGPGYTTDMLSRVTQARKVFGLDFSGSFINTAQTYYPKLKFIKHDVTSHPFPIKGDIIYCRFLLSHLGNTKNTIINWIDELNPYGMLFIDELENIITDHDLFQKYLDINGKLINSQGASLYIGRQLNEDVKTLNVIYNESIILPVENSMAAWWFYPNTVSIWKTDDFVKTIITEEQREKISRQIFEIAEKKSTEKDITWIMKRIIIKKQ